MRRNTGTGWSHRKRLISFSKSLSCFGWALLLTTLGCNLSHGKLPATEAQLNRLSVILLSKQPADSSHEFLADVITESGLNPDDLLRDAWGNPIEVTIEQGESGIHYEVRSFGSDGERGSCCTAFTSEPGADLVMRDGEWLQAIAR